ncbi:hypothetical protein LTS15_002883 [Exophiala xenobiotica]|nr:hypothetical protein LTS15_002883 [Exophiala xenobiotica]
MLSSCIQAVVMCPDVAKKAQAEIDAVIGDDRVPNWSDYEKAPYGAAIVEESHRWRPAAPLPVPHALSEGKLPPLSLRGLNLISCIDEWIDGKFLPKGTANFLSVWGLHHDESEFPDHHVFHPDHYKGRTLLESEYANSAEYDNRGHYGYGNGRRLCPGIHLADRNFFHTISKNLWAFDIDKAVDPKTGKSIIPVTNAVTCSRGALSACAYEFPCKLTVRSRAKRETIMKEYAEAKADVFPQYGKTGMF